MSFLSKLVDQPASKPSVLASMAVPTMGHDDPSSGFGHAIDVVMLREPMSPFSRFQISCIGLGLALLGWSLGMQGGYWAPLKSASLIFVPGMLVVTAITGLLALKYKRSLK